MKHLTTLASAVVIALSVSACSDNKTAEDYLSEGTQLVAAGQYNEAIVTLKNAVKLAPRNEKIRHMLGKAYIKEGSYLNAEKELERALELGVTDLMGELSFVKMKLSDAEGVLEILKQSSGLADEQYSEVLLNAGIVTMIQNKKLESEDYFSQVISINSNSQNAALAQIYLAKLNQNNVQALNSIENVLKQTPNESQLMLLQASIYSELERYADAATVYERYIQLKPKEEEVRFYEVNSLLQDRQMELAEEKTNALLSRYRKAALANQFKAQIEYHKQNYKEARSFADTALQQDNSLNVSRVIAGVSAYYMENYEQAYSYLKPLDQYLNFQHPVKRVIISIQTRLGYSNTIADSALDIDNIQNLSPEEIALTSNALVETGDIESAKKLVERAYQEAPDNIDIASLRGKFLLSEQNPKGIVLSVTPDNKDVELSLAMHSIQLGEVDKAQSIAEKWIESEDFKALGYLLKGIIDTNKNDTEAARQSFEAVLSIKKDDVSALYNLAVIDRANKDTDNAKDKLEQVLQLVPTHKGALLALNDLRIQLNEHDQNIEFLYALFEVVPDSYDVMFMLAQALRIKGDANESMQLLSTFKDKPNLPDTYWIALADGHIQNGNFAQAKNTLSKALNDFPGSYLLRLKHIGLLDIEKRYPEALSAAKSAYDIFENNTRLEMLLAYLNTQMGNIESAQRHLSKLSNKQISHPMIDATHGHVALLKKDVDNAIDFFSLAYEKQPNGRNALYLARALKLDNQGAQAEKTLENFLLIEPENTQIMLLLSSLYEPAQVEKISKQYRNILKVDGNNIVVLNNLAWLEHERNNAEVALPLIEKGYALNPNFLPVLETYGVILAGVKKYPQGKKILKDALAKGSLDTNVLLSLSEIYLSEGNAAQAHALLQKADNMNEAQTEKHRKLIGQL